MISAKAIQYLENKYVANSIELDFASMFADITDDMLKQALKMPHITIWGVRDNLVDMTADKEVRAHLLGWSSYAEQLADLERCREMQKGK